MRISDLLAVVLATAVFQARVPESPANRSAQVRIREVLLDPSPDVEAKAARLAQAGSAVVPGLFELLATGALPGSAEGETISGKQEELVVSTLAHFRRGELGRRVDALFEPAARAGAKLDGFRLLGKVGERADLALLCDALRGPDPDADPDPEHARLFQVSVASILGRDELAYPAVRNVLHGATPTLRYYLLGALAQTDSKTALEILSTELAKRPEETAYILTESAKLAAAVELPVDGAVAASIRLHLFSDDASLVRPAAECLGGLQDVDSVYDLVQLLGHAHPDVSRAALEALRTITGANFAADAERWRAWLLAEAEWKSEAFPRISTVFGGTNALEKMAALQELAGHPLHRVETARLLESALTGESSPLVAAACSALRQIGATTAVPFLETCAADPSPAVAGEAKAALDALRRRAGKSPGAPQGP
jgi:HEAT repeat protein